MTFFDWLNHQPPGTASFIGTLAGSTLGFLALLAGALFNAKLNRERDGWLREQDRVALATALYAELKWIRDILTDNCELRMVTSAEGISLRVPLNVSIMPKLIDKLGLLRSETITAVTTAYMIVDQYKQTQTIQMNKVKVRIIDTALKALEPYLK